jgi:uncharacterized membrane protein
MYSKVKLLGHPVHPMLVAYPIAFYTSTFVAYLIYTFGGDPFWFKVAVVANIAGVVMAAITAIPGFVDWAFGVPASSPAKRRGLIHLALNVSALLLFLISAIVNTGQFNAVAPPAGWGLALSLLGVLCTVGAGALGWTMIQSDHVGVELTPAQMAIDRERDAQRAADEQRRGGPAPA